MANSQDHGSLLYRDFAVGPVGRCALIDVETIPDRGFPNIKGFHAYSLASTESMLIEAPVGEMCSQDFRIYIAGATNVSLPAPRGTLQFLKPYQNTMKPDLEGPNQKTNRFHVFADRYQTNDGSYSDKLHMNVTTGGNMEQYHTAPYSYIRPFRGFATDFTTPRGASHCISFRFKIDESTQGDVEAWTSINRLEAPSSSNELPPSPEQWMDAIQVSLSQQRLSKSLTFNFRFIENVPGSDKVRPKLYDVVDVQPREFMEWFGRNKVTEYCITLRELKKGWWKKE